MSSAIPNSVSIVSYGGGVDSTAMLIGMVAHQEPPPHAILFADTGGEKPHTYDYVTLFSEWLRSKRYPTITIVSKAGNERTLEEDCLEKNTLPAIAYGYRTCSQKYKAEPQEKWCNNDHFCRKTWLRGGKVVRLIGYDNDEYHRACYYDDPKYENRYPLIEWRWGREICAYVIKKIGLPHPGKSSCFFCPHNTKPEILEIQQQYPHLLSRALVLEANARRSLRKVKGLGRRFAWRDFLEGKPTDESLEAEKSKPCGCYDG